MKEIIMDVLDDMSESQINLGSSAARETVAGLISATLNDRGRWIEFDEQTLNGQRAKESWVWDICGKNTYDVDWDYIGSGTNHLGCELEIEMADEDARTMPEGLKRAKELAQEAIEEEAIRCKMPYVNQRWLGGTLTNQETIRKSINKLRFFEFILAVLIL